jgi:hypothetical protein
MVTGSDKTASEGAPADNAHPTAVGHKTGLPPFAETQGKILDGLGRKLASTLSETSPVRQAVSRIQMLADSISEEFSAGARQLRGAAASPGGHIVAAAGIALLGMEVKSLNEKAAAAVSAGDLSQEAYSQYRLILAGHAVATPVDVSMIASATIVDGVYDQWARENITNQKLRNELRPSSALDSMGFKSRSAAEIKLAAFYDCLPGQVGPDTPSALHDLIAIKQQIRCEAMAEASDSARKGVFTSPRASDVKLAYDARLKDLQDSFGQAYDARLKDGTVDRALSAYYQQPPDRDAAGVDSSPVSPALRTVLSLIRQ